MKYDAKRALELLRAGIGKGEGTGQGGESGQGGAIFREGQEEAIRHVVEGKGRLLVVQKTGWGKSFVYFIATKLLREADQGPALLISPLLALMRNQIEAAERMGVRAATIHSGNQDEWNDVQARLHRDDVDILLISPERLANDYFVGRVLAPVAERISLLVIDEAHCISDWGHDFRPHYRLLGRMVEALPANMRLLATTATANDRVMCDLQEVLGPNITAVRGDLARNSLTLQTLRMTSQAERMAWLADRLGTLDGSGIIYTLTVRDAYQLAEWLKSQGYNVEAYSGQTGDDRPALEDALLGNRVKALVATTALGMGFDKPDLAFVIHYQMPGSVVAYYQQVGRAGRAIDAAYGVLLSGEEDADINDWFINSAFPTRNEVAALLETLEQAPGGLSTSELLEILNISQGRIMKALDLLDLESPAPVAKQGRRWQLTASKLNDAFWERAERLTRLRRGEQEQMRAYVDLPFGKHMAFLLGALDGDTSKVASPSLPPLPPMTDPKRVQAAIAFLRRSDLPLEPRKKWPDGGMPEFGTRGAIPLDYRAQPGRVLCVWGDAGWGSLVRQGKYHDGRFSDELVTACADMLRRWSPKPAPTWVTCVPSLRHPELVPDFARRLAGALQLPFEPVLVKTGPRPEQKTMQNSTQQARNVDGALALVGAPSAEPVLLVDDMVDSRWTLTVVAWLLRANGSGLVWPLALAQTGRD